MTRISAIITTLLLCVATVYGAEMVPQEVVCSPTVCHAAAGISEKLAGAAQLLGQAKDIACEYVKNPAKTVALAGLGFVAGVGLGHIAKKAKELHSRAREYFKYNPWQARNFVNNISIASMSSMFTAAVGALLLQTQGCYDVANKLMNFVSIANISLFCGVASLIF